MDSFNFHFERMSNLDLHPLSLPISRLSPAKSASSTDQFLHHHSKGDSAYSSFSGGSSAPEYSSLFPEDLHQHSNHYADLKYVKAVYNPNILKSSSKSMDHLYHSMEGIAQQYRQEDTNGCHGSQEPLPPSSFPSPPPPLPVRLDSFVTTKNLENSRTRQSPEGQLADRSHQRSQTANPDVPCTKSDPGYAHRVSQHYQRNSANRDILAQAVEQQKSANNLSRLPPMCQSQVEHPKQPGLGSDQRERELKQASSTSDSSYPEQHCSSNSRHGPQNTVSGSIQHKGQFYFVTGVRPSAESANARQAPCSGKASVEPYRHVEERSHTTAENLFKTRHRRRSYDDLCEREVLYSRSLDKEHSSHSPDQVLSYLENAEPSQRLIGRESGRHHTSSHPFFYCGPKDLLPPYSHTESQPTPMAMDQSMVPNNEEQGNKGRRQPLGDVPSEKINKETTPLLYHLTSANRLAMMNKIENESSSDVGCHGSEGNGGPLCQPEKDMLRCMDEKCLNKSSNSSLDNSSKRPVDEKPEEGPYPCNTLDDSYKKYYREKIKDAQSKVLRETSFKRKDLQLSWPHRFKEQPVHHPSILSPVVSSSQDTIFTADKPSHLPPQATATGNTNEKRETEVHRESHQSSEKDKVKDSDQEKEKCSEQETTRSPKVAKPQVARIGSRKRLSHDQKKMCFSEPEKLHRLADGPTHKSSHSLGNELESQLLVEESGKQSLGAQGKLVESRCRTLSASSVSKNTLKHIQHKALLEYIERKMGHKNAEPQQPCSQVPKQRHSTADRPSDWGPRPYSGNAGPKKKLNRPLSAGRILDSISSSIRHAQFSSSEHGEHSQPCSWKELPSSPGKSASAESLLDQQEQSKFIHARSTSTPHPFQISSDFSVSKDAPSTTDRNKNQSVKERLRFMEQRGKSMEELGVSKVSHPSSLSKSSEQLDMLHNRMPNPNIHPHQSRFLFKVQTQPLQRFIRHRKLSGEAVLTRSGYWEPPHHRRGISVSECASGTAYSTSSSSGSPRMDSPSDIPHPFSSESCAPESNLANTSEETTSSKSQTESLIQTFVKDSSAENQLVVPSSESIHEVALSLGVTTDPTLWPSLPEGERCAQQSASVQSVQSDEAETSNEEPGEDKAYEMEDKHKSNVEAAEADDEGPESSTDIDPSQWATLVEDLVAMDKSLVHVLCPVTNRKTALMLMEQLLSEDTLLMEEHYRKRQEETASILDQPTGSTEDDEGHSSCALPSNSLDSGSECAQTVNQRITGGDITEKKRQLITLIEAHLKDLEEQKSLLQQEELENGVRGGAMDALVKERCLPMEHERYALFIGDLERVVSLLLCLSARLARVQNALTVVDEHTDSEEKQSLDNRHRLLCKQRDDAKDLKDNLDKRERMVSSFLSKYLTEAELQGYRRFVQTKASLLIRQKDLEERERLGEEQRDALVNSLPP
ncbi:protein Shroom1 isoform X2 [Denticeps clupeoides]|uniref:Shroom family member 1 n=1 Tax=Denticeps clupeoides TaxID=299321 RepID=A0AAY4BE10_9TELE|nr:protein Shroom1-like isoform X2 [Denticeps clupeoides]